VTRIGEPLRITVSVCLVAALLSATLGSAVGQRGPALALAGGLLIGSCNGYLARGAVGAELDFRATSVVRLLLLSAAALAFAALIDVSAMPFAIAGLGLAQVALAVVSGIHLARQ
jgi:hypothetical protein